MYRYLGALLEINSYLNRRRFPVATDSNIIPFYKKKKKNGTLTGLLAPRQLASSSCLREYLRFRYGEPCYTTPQQQHLRFYNRRNPRYPFSATQKYQGLRLFIC